MTRAYHVDAEAGDDAADGTSPAAAWRTFAPLASVDLKPGDDVLLKGVFSGCDGLVLHGGGKKDAVVVVAPYDCDRVTIDGLRDVVGPWVEVSPEDHATPAPGSRLWRNSSPAFSDRVILVLDGEHAGWPATASSEGRHGLPLTEEGGWLQDGAGTLLNCSEDPARAFRSIQKPGVKILVDTADCPFALVGGISARGGYGRAFNLGRGFAGDDLDGSLCARIVFSTIGPGRLVRCYAHDNGAGSGEGEHGFFPTETKAGELVELIDCEAARCGEDSIQPQANTFLGHLIVTGGRYRDAAENGLVDVKTGDVTVRGRCWASSHTQALVTIQGKARTVTLEDVLLNQYAAGAPVIQGEGASARYVLQAAAGAGGPRLWSAGPRAVVLRPSIESDSDFSSAVVVVEGKGSAENSAVRIGGSGPGGHRLRHMTIRAHDGPGIVQAAGTAASVAGCIVEAADAAYQQEAGDVAAELHANHFRSSSGAPVIIGGQPIEGNDEPAAFEEFPFEFIVKDGAAVTIRIPGNPIADGSPLLIQGLTPIEYCGWHYVSKVDADLLAYIVDDELPPATGAGVASRLHLTAATPARTRGTGEPMHDADGLRMGGVSLGALAWSPTASS